MPQSKAPAPEDTGTDLVPLHQVREAVISGYVPDVVDTEALALEFAERLLHASTPESLLTVAEAQKVQDVLGVPFLMQDARFLKSDYDEGGFSVYALVSGVTKDGEPLNVACGGRNVVVQCLRLKEEGWLPRAVAFMEAGRQKANRNRPIYLTMDDEWQRELDAVPVSGEVVN